MTINNIKKYKNKKIALNILTITILFAFPLLQTHAQERYGLENFADFIGTGINLAFYAGITVFLVMLFVTSMKFGLSQGDPEGLKGASQSLTYAVLGFIVVLLFYTIVRIVLKTFLGSDPLATKTVKGMFLKGIDELIKWLGGSDSLPSSTGGH